jgi:hypothetical protein
MSPTIRLVAGDINVPSDSISRHAWGLPDIMSKDILGVCKVWRLMRRWDTAEKLILRGHPSESRDEHAERIVAVLHQIVFVASLMERAASAT